MGEVELKEEVAALSSKHRELMRWLISGATHAECAARSGISKKHVTRLVGSELFKSEMNRMQDELDKELYEKKADTAIEIQEMYLAEAKNNLSVRVDIREKEIESPASRLKACDAIDEMAGIKKVEPGSQKVTLEMGDGWKAMLSDALLKGGEPQATSSASVSAEGEATPAKDANAEG